MPLLQDANSGIFQDTHTVTIDKQCIVYEVYEVYVYIVVIYRTPAINSRIFPLFLFCRD